MNRVQVLIISNTLDFGTDYICVELEKRDIEYFRINRDYFKEYHINFNVTKSEMILIYQDEEYLISRDLLKTIYYRAPIYLRDNYQPNLSPEEQLYRSQWTAFIRNLAVFDNVLWVNNPVATFEAENKILQLKIAKDIGFLCPHTIITNNLNNNILFEDTKFIVKSLDTGIFRIGDNEGFIYSNVVNGKKLNNANLDSLPIMLQNYIYPKRDLRVTVVGNDIFSVKILKDNMGIDGDWRLQKDNILFEPIQLPSSIEKKCLVLLNRLKLKYGAIDLILSEGKYYFIEINPTGEWAWLVEQANLNIHKSITNLLLAY